MVRWRESGEAQSRRVPAKGGDRGHAGVWSIRRRREEHHLTADGRVASVGRLAVSPSNWVIVRVALSDPVNNAFTVRRRDWLLLRRPPVFLRFCPTPRTRTDISEYS